MNKIITFLFLFIAQNYSFSQKKEYFPPFVSECSCSINDSMQKIVRSNKTMFIYYHSNGRKHVVLINKKKDQLKNRNSKIYCYYPNGKKKGLERYKYFKDNWVKYVVIHWDEHEMKKRGRGQFQKKS